MNVNKLKKSITYFVRKKCSIGTTTLFNWLKEYGIFPIISAFSFCLNINQDFCAQSSCEIMSKIQLLNTFKSSSFTTNFLNWINFSISFGICWLWLSTFYVCVNFWCIVDKLSFLYDLHFIVEHWKIISHIWALNCYI